MAIDDEEDDDPIARAQQARERAELDLIVGGNPERDGEREHAFNMKHVDLGKKKRKNKTRKKQMEEEEDSDGGGADGDDGFRIDTKCASLSFGRWFCCRPCRCLHTPLLTCLRVRVCALQG